MNPFQKGDLVYTTTVVNLRKSPGALNKAPADIVAELPVRSKLQITHNRIEEVDGMIWYPVTVLGEPALGKSGWVAAKTPDGTVLLEREANQPVTPPISSGSGLHSGQRVRTKTVLRLRRTPGYLNKAEDDIIAELTEAASLLLLGGPVSADGLPWWRVRSLDGAAQKVEGWVAEATATGQQLLAPDLTEPPAKISKYRVGDQLQTLSWVRLRRTAGYIDKAADDILAEILPGALVILLEGPRAVDELVWWQVRVSVSGQPQVVGWMAETAPGGVALFGQPVQQKPADFRKGQLVVVANSSTRVRRRAGYINKPDNDVLGELFPRTTVVVLEGTVKADDLYWWRIGGIGTKAPLLGWVAQRAPNGEDLLRLPPWLPGTRIPDAKTGTYLATPFSGRFGISQLWGENPNFYSRYRYDGVPLRGHNGIDFYTPEGTDIVATDSGQVVMAGFEPDGFGLYILMGHGWGQSIYAHLSSVVVQQGQNISKGSLIGRSGNTGGSTGPHLHFAIRIHPYSRQDGWGGYADPLPYLNPSDVFLPPYVLDASTRQSVVPPYSDSYGKEWDPPRMAEDRPGMTRP